MPQTLVLNIGQEVSTSKRPYVSNKTHILAKAQSALSPTLYGEALTMQDWIDLAIFMQAEAEKNLDPEQLQAMLERFKQFKAQPDNA
ncbi:hypothetical protein H6G00_00865 [Leptolyngbya sp. FACHB-541]|uniref:hypothetical protein n=1 Tax=Leptolyngbya sp. FACHB-541 TaxID=2692810 RepID=UPI0016826DFB|nr:hypothetical protein [Leptolyngbya sp. FACHB-541]MBD1995179.1 hypothetical protein [Leptolyngbya sp. FACHB-541]